MLVREVMTRAVKTITPETRLQEVASIMCLNRFSGLPVVEGDKLVGILAERDVLRYLFPSIKDIMTNGMGSIDFEGMEAEYKKVLPLKAADLMNTGIITVDPDMPILKAVSVMAKNNFRRIPVTENNNQLAGMISLGDIHRAIFMKSFAGS